MDKYKLIRVTLEAWRKLRQMAFDDELPMGILVAYLIEVEWQRRQQSDDKGATDAQ